MPTPDGYGRVTPEMSAVDRLAEQMADPMNDQLTSMGSFLDSEAHLLFFALGFGGILFEPPTFLSQIREPRPGTRGNLVED